jgi:hypothetical protein
LGGNHPAREGDLARAGAAGKAPVCQVAISILILGVAAAISGETKSGFPDLWRYR